MKSNKVGGYSSYILAGDIGGTNTNLGVFGVKKDKLGLDLNNSPIDKLNLG